QWAHPFGIAPMGITALSAYRGDLVLARAAARAGVPMIVSGASLIRLEDIIAVNPDAWFQAYLPGDPAKTEALVARIASAGYRTLVITVDTPVSANRENNVRAGFSTPLRPSLRLAWEGITHPRWLIGTFARTLIRHGMPHFENSYAQRGAPIVSPDAVRDNSDRGYMNWHLFERVRKLWKGRILVKGVMDARDAVMARDLGAQGIILSNHGGRQLDGTVSPLRVLPAVVAACPDLPVMIDSGIRRGTDVLKALALGARFVFVGRPFNFAAAIGGEAGVDHAIGLLGSEIARNMALLGVNRVHQLRPEMLMRLGG
ncbi:MAG: alpha-hydroxy acid oxidase, partial [Quisquiliibacterium sp.]